MKNALRSTLVLLALAGAAAGVNAAPPAQSAQSAQSGQAGRFQMIEATFTNAPGNSLQQFKRLAILDTATGALTVCDYAHKDAGKMADGQEYWMTNGACVPFVGDKPWYLPKEKVKPVVKDKPAEKEKESPKEKAGNKAANKDKK
ncbi:MAG: hypothetical protein H7Z39_06455 [Burkholderiaceae bacterium]|nr:hypothetical protein [Burkholderiaceae bacterium]